jgi:hypothetical protein
MSLREQQKIDKKNEKKKETNVGGIKWIYCKGENKECHERGCGAAEGRLNLR